MRYLLNLTLGVLLYSTPAFSINSEELLKEVEFLVDSKPLKKYDQEVLYDYVEDLCQLAKENTSSAIYHLSQILITEWKKNKQDLPMPNFYEELYKRAIDSFTISEKKEDRFYLYYDSYFSTSRTKEDYEKVIENFKSLNSLKGDFYAKEVLRASTNTPITSFENIQNETALYTGLGD
ncbi:MAG TPA: hypothetical protein VI959_03535, partial [Alphaproteobacteria bacterium]|nr:hypothetical protein [Alphaproteobacteria bacterium]